MVSKSGLNANYSRSRDELESAKVVLEERIARSVVGLKSDRQRLKSLNNILENYDQIVLNLENENVKA